MRLADFIDHDIDALLDDWSVFARRLDPVRVPLPPASLQPSVRALLRHLAADLRESAPAPGSIPAIHAPASARLARVHGRNRLRAGFTLKEIVAEYCALRASIIKRWSDSTTGIDQQACLDLQRFNLALDQALQESITRYSGGLERARDLFVGILAHDLRTPLGAILMSAQLLLRHGEDLPLACLQAASRIDRSGARMQRMIDDLLDFTRTRLGNPLPLSLAPANLEEICYRAADEIMAAHPGHALQLDCAGDLTGRWDGNRLAQLFANLLGNAMQHGRPNQPISLTARRAGPGVVAEVHNYGPAIPPNMQDQIFDPLMRGPRPDDGDPRRPGSGMGLGLYIARQIATAHHGTLSVVSSYEAGTTFVLRLPLESTPC